MASKIPSNVKWGKWKYNSNKDVRTRTGRVDGVRGIGEETQWKRAGKWRRWGH